MEGYSKPGKHGGCHKDGGGDGGEEKRQIILDFPCNFDKLSRIGINRCFNHKALIWCGNPVAFCEKEGLR